MPELSPLQEADRQLTICNACRYCEGLCATFQAIEIRRNFAEQDVFYLANLCHDCRACYSACMFTPPHEFAINIPQLMSQARLQSYERWSWPLALAKSFSNRRIGIFLGLGTAGLLALLAAVLRGPALITRHIGPGAFYEIVPYPVMAGTALLLALFAFAIWLRGAVYSWSETAERSTGRVNLVGFFQAIGAMLTLRYLGGGGPGCSYPEERPSSARRIFHSFVFWGFLFDFVSTSLAFVYQDLLHRLPPYTLSSAPVVFGTIGGIGIVIGTAGLIYLKTKSDPSQASPHAYGIDYDFLAILGLAALTGILTLVFRETAALGVFLAIHLAIVAALFVTAPYGKFVHALYRSLALIQFYREQNSQ